MEAPSGKRSLVQTATLWWERQKDWVKLAVVVGPMVALGVALGLGLGLSDKAEKASVSGSTAYEEQMGYDGNVDELDYYDGNVSQLSSYDANAKSLVRNAMTAVESAYVDVRAFDEITLDELVWIEPSIEFIMSPDPMVAVNPSEGLAFAALDQVCFYGGSPTDYALGTLSDSGHTFGVYVDKGAGGGNLFFVDGVEGDW